MSINFLMAALAFTAFSLFKVWSTSLELNVRSKFDNPKKVAILLLISSLVNSGYSLEILLANNDIFVPLEEML